MVKKTEYICTFLAGGIIYSLIEIGWRGYTHWSMTIAGGVCFVAIHLINKTVPHNRRLLKYTACALLITSIELASGAIFNLAMGLNVWDYSNLPGNIMGQICPQFTGMWFLLSIPACMLSDLVIRFFTVINAREKGLA